MKIAILIERFDPLAGGAERSTAQIAQQLAERGHEVTILTWWHKQEHPLPPVTIEARSTRRKLSGVRLGKFVRWTADALRSGRIDTSLSVTTAVPAAIVQPRGGTVAETLDRNIALRTSPLARTAKKITTALSYKRRRLLALERQTLNDPSVRYIAAVSDYVADQLKRHYQIDDDRVQVINNASQMPAADDAQRAGWRSVIRRGFGAADTTTVYLFAALNPRLKGARSLLEAVRLLKQQGRNFRLFIAGAVSYRLQERAQRLGIRDRVSFVGPTQNMAALYCAADVTVHPTFYDPSSKVVIESLMMGTPAISTAYNGASALLAADGADHSARLGLVIPDPADHTALAAAMAELADPARRTHCHAMRHQLAADLSMGRHVDQLEHLLESAATPLAGPTRLVV